MEFYKICEWNHVRLHKNRDQNGGWKRKEASFVESGNYPILRPTKGVGLEWERGKEHKGERAQLRG